MMFERFSDRARTVVTTAQDVARYGNLSAIGPAAILVGLWDEGRGIAAEALKEMGATRGDLIGLLRPDLDEPAQYHIPFTGAGKRVLEYALRQALRLGHNYIGTEHILLAFDYDMISDSDEYNECLTYLTNLDPDKGLRQTVLEKLGILGSEANEFEGGPTAQNPPDIRKRAAKALMHRLQEGPQLSYDDVEIFKDILQRGFLDDYS